MKTITWNGTTFEVPFADLLPPLSESERTALREDIRENGVQIPVILDELKRVLDGQNRLEIAAELGLASIPMEIRGGLSEEAKETLAWSLNLNRRHLSKESRSAYVAAMRGKGWSTRKIAEVLGVTPQTVVNDAPVQLSNSGQVNTPAKVQTSDGKTYPAQRADEEERTERAGVAQELAAAGKTVREIAQATGTSVGTAAADLKRTPTKVSFEGSPREVSKTVALLDRAAQAGLELPESSTNLIDLRRQVGRQEKQVERNEQLKSIDNPSPELLTATKFPVILADPPWRYDHIKRECDAIENHYQTMDLEDICAMDVYGLAEENAVLYMWTTAPKVQEAIQVLGCWGFAYKTCFVWVKDSIGMGYWARGRHEILMVAVKGNFSPPHEDARFDSVIEAPKGRHSAKPDRCYEIIEAAFPHLPKIELFCRTPRKGWNVWGNQAGVVA